MQGSRRGGGADGGTRNCEKDRCVLVSSCGIWAVDLAGSPTQSAVRAAVEGLTHSTIKIPINKRFDC